MKDQSFKRIRATLLVAFLGSMSAVNAGDLDPPAGPVTPTMKTLIGVEPRIAVNATNTPGDADSLYKITESGSYYLTGNIIGESGKNGIEIEAENVTLDLMGFAVIGLNGTTLSGVVVTATGNNITIVNGTVRDWGVSGVAAMSARNGQLVDLQASGNGEDGLAVGLGSLVRNCVAHSNARDGIAAFIGSTIIDCTSTENGRYGISAFPWGFTINRCTAYNNDGVGIAVGAMSMVTGCTSVMNADAGISTGSSTTVSGCTTTHNTKDGITVTTMCRVVGNNASASGFNGDGAGIHVLSSNNRIEGNHVADSDRGIDVDEVGNVIVKNSASANTTNYDIVPGNDVGPIGTAATSTSPWANIAN